MSRFIPAYLQISFKGEARAKKPRSGDLLLDVVDIELVPPRVQAIADRLEHLSGWDEKDSYGIHAYDEGPYPLLGEGPMPGWWTLLLPYRHHIWAANGAHNLLKGRETLYMDILVQIKEIRL